MKKMLRKISLLLVSTMLASTVNPIFAEDITNVSTIAENKASAALDGEVQNGVNNPEEPTADNSKADGDDEKNQKEENEGEKKTADDAEDEKDNNNDEEKDQSVNTEENSDEVITKSETNTQSDEERKNEIKLFNARYEDYGTKTEDMIIYQNEDYEGDFIDSFDAVEWGNTTPRGLMAKVSKVVDPENPNNHVLMVDGSKNTNERYPKNTCVAFYQGEMNTRTMGYNQFTPEGLGFEDGLLVFKIDAYFKREMKDYITRGDRYYLMPSSDRSAYHKYCAFDFCYFRARDNDTFSIQSNVLEKGYAAEYDKWHTFTFVYDCKTQKAGYYVDGTLIWYDKTNSAWRLSLAVGYKLFMFDCLIPENMCYFDNVQILRPLKDAELASAEFNHTTGKVELAFSSMMDKREVEKIKLKNNAGEDVSDCIQSIEISEDGKTAYLVLNKTKLTAETEYSVFIPGGKDGVKDAFCRIISDEDIDTAKFKIGRTIDIYVTEKNLKSVKINNKQYDDKTTDLNNVKSIEYTAAVKNDTAENKTVAALLAVYSKGDKLLDSCVCERTLSPVSEAEFTFELNNEYAEPVTDIRLYTFENDSGRLRPVHEPDVLTGDYLNLRAASEKILPDGYSVLLNNKEENYISIAGNLTGEDIINNKSIAVSVFAENSDTSKLYDVIAMGACEVKTDGSFAYSFKLTNRETAKYKIFVYTDSAVYKQDFEYISIKDIADFVRSIANGEVSYDNYYKMTLPLSNLIGTDFGTVVKTQRDIDLFNRRIDEGRTGYIGENDEKTVSNYNKVLFDYAQEAKYLQGLDNLSDKEEIYQKLLIGTSITNIQFGFYSTLITAQADVVLSAFVGKVFTCKEEVYKLFNDKVAEAQKYFPEKNPPEKKQFTSLDFENNYDISNFKGNYDKFRIIDVSNVKVTNDPVNTGNHVLMVSGNSAVSTVDDKNYTQTSVLLSENYDDGKKYSDYGIDFNDSIIVWKCDFYFDRKIKDYVGKGFMLQPTREGGYAGAGISYNTQFRNGKANDSVSYEFMYISTFDDENSVGNRTVLCDEWHSMTQVYDAKTKKVSTYIDGQIVAINQRVNAPLSDRSVFGLQLHSPAYIPENVIYFDNIEHYVMAKRPGIEAYTYNPISGVVTIEFATPIDNNNLKKFTMTKNGEDAGMLIKSRSLDKTGCYVTITLDKDNLELNSQYMFSIPTSLTDIYYQPISDKKVEIGINTGKTNSIYIDTDSPKAVIGYNGETLEKSDSLNYTMIVNNVTENVIDITAAVCVYGDDNELLASEFKNESIPSGGGNIKFELYGFKNAKYVGLYLFSSDKNGNPAKLVHSPDYIENKPAFTQKALTSAVLPEFSVLTSDIEKKYLSFAGNTGEKSTDGLVMTFLLKGKNTGFDKLSENIVAMGLADNNSGAYNYSFKYSGDSGEYTAYVFTDSGIFKKDIVYTTFTDTVQFIKDIKDGRISQSDIYAKTLPYTDVLGVDLKYTVKSDRDINLLNSFVVKNKEKLTASTDMDYLANYKSILERALREIKFLQELEEIKYYGLIYAKLSEYKDVNNIDFTVYNKLSDNSKATVTTAMVGKTFTDAAAVKSLFDSETSKANNGKSDGNGSQAGRGNSRGTTQSPSSANNILAADYNTEKTISGFSDLENCAWAHEAIMNLKTKGIISGVSENEFAPNDTVTREQFVKMIILALGENDASEVCGFDDVDKTAWYYRFVAAAVNKEIIMGISEKEFGVGRSISRQDMACMVYRALSYKGMTFADKKTDFDDFDEITDYAKEAVSSLAGMKIINGMDDNIFAPHSTATRAQAAVIIYSMLRRMK